MNGTWIRTVVDASVKWLKFSLLQHKSVYFFINTEIYLLTKYLFIM